ARCPSCWASAAAEAVTRSSKTAIVLMPGLRCKPSSTCLHRRRPPDMIVIMSKPLIELLRRLPASERRYPAGKRIFHQDDKVLVLHQVLDGNVHLVRHNIGGRALVLQRAAGHGILAEASIFAARYHCDAVAVLPTRTRAIDKSVLTAALARDPNLARA